MGALVDFEIAFGGERLAAVRAFEWPVSGVCSEMNLNRTRTGETLQADMTLVTTTQLLAGVSSGDMIHVRPCRGWNLGRSYLLYLGIPLDFLWFVCKYVLFHVSSGSEGFTTDITFKWPVFGMASIMNLQSAPAAMLLTADITCCTRRWINSHAVCGRAISSAGFRTAP